MLNTIYQEYIENINSDKKFPFIYALICFWRVPHFRACVYIRLIQNTNLKILKELVRKKLCLKYGIEIGNNTKIGKGLVIRHINGIVLGDEVVLGNDVTLYHGVTLGQRNGRYPTVLDGVTCYPNSIILGDIVIGHNSVVMANSVVLKSVPDNCIVAGNPANVVKTLVN